MSACALLLWRNPFTTYYRYLFPPQLDRYMSVSVNPLPPSPNIYRAYPYTYSTCNFYKDSNVIAWHKPLFKTGFKLRHCYHLLQETPSSSSCFSPWNLTTNRELPYSGRDCQACSGITQSSTRRSIVHYRSSRSHSGTWVRETTETLLFVLSETMHTYQWIIVKISKDRYFQFRLMANYTVPVGTLPLHPKGK